MSLAALQSQSQPQPPTSQPLYNGSSLDELTNGSSIEPPVHQHKQSANGYLNVSTGPTGPGHHATASTSSLNLPRVQHSRAVSLPSFSQEPFGPVSQPRHGRPGITCEISFIQDEVQDINRDDDGTFTLTLQKNAKTMFAKDVVLAVRNFTVTANPHLSHLPGYFPSPWPTTRLISLPVDDPIIILGSRLSAIDAANALVDNGHRGPITFMSRCGRLPRVHGAPVPFPRRHNLYTKRTTCTDDSWIGRNQLPVQSRISTDRYVH